MKKSYLYPLLALTCIVMPLQAQTGPSQDAFSDLQATLNEFMDSMYDNPESLIQNYDEMIRRNWLMSSDIRMKMDAEFERDDLHLSGVTFWTSARTASLYAEFDWQNMAESIRAKSSESITGAGLFPVGAVTSTQGPTDETMYVDALGFWYVPTYINDSRFYYKVNLTAQMQNMVQGLELAIENGVVAQVAQAMDQVAMLAVMTLSEADYNWLTEFVPDEILRVFFEEGVEALIEPVIEELVNSHYVQLGTLPPLIHFAYVISPTLARTQFDVQEQPITWRGQANCTKMTVVSGRDAGYQVVFDRYGRLIHLRDTDDGTADYYYDRDVTVNIPEATPLTDVIRIPGISGQ